MGFKRYPEMANPVWGFLKANGKRVKVSVVRLNEAMEAPQVEAFQGRLTYGCIIVHQKLGCD